MRPMITNSLEDLQSRIPEPVLATLRGLVAAEIEAAHFPRLSRERMRDLHASAVVLGCGADTSLRCWGLLQDGGAGS